MLCCIMEKQYFEELSVVKVLLEWKACKQQPWVGEG